MYHGFLKWTYKDLGLEGGGGDGGGAWILLFSSFWLLYVKN
jgi:hypothetical protein